jgi:hypothetical protein
VVGARHGVEQVERIGREPHADDEGVEPGLGQLAKDRLGRQPAVADLEPIAEPQDDERDQQGRKTIGVGDASAGSEVQAEHVGERDRVEQGDLALEGAIALLEQGATGMAVGLAGIHDPLEDRLSPPHGKIAYAGKIKTVFARTSGGDSLPKLGTATNFESWRRASVLRHGEIGSCP